MDKRSPPGPPPGSSRRSPGPGARAEAPSHIAPRKLDRGKPAFLVLDSYTHTEQVKRLTLCSGGQGVAGSNPAAPTRNARPLITVIAQVSGLHHEFELHDGGLVTMVLAPRPEDCY